MWKASSYLISLLILFTSSCKPDQSINWKKELKGLGQFCVNDSSAITFYNDSLKWTITSTGYPLLIKSDTVLISANSFRNFIPEKYRDSVVWERNIIYKISKRGSSISLYKVNGQHFFPENLRYYKPSDKPDPNFKFYQEEIVVDHRWQYVRIDSNYNLKIQYGNGFLNPEGIKIHCFNSNAELRKDCISYVNLLIKDRRKSKEFTGIICDAIGGNRELIVNDSIYYYDEYLPHQLNIPFYKILLSHTSVHSKECDGNKILLDFFNRYPIAMRSKNGNPTVQEIIKFLPPIIDK